MRCVRCPLLGVAASSTSALPPRQTNLNRDISIGIQYLRTRGRRGGGKMQVQHALTSFVARAKRCSKLAPRVVSSGDRSILHHILPRAVVFHPRSTKTTLVREVRPVFWDQENKMLCCSYPTEETSAARKRHQSVQDTGLFTCSHGCPTRALPNDHFETEQRRF